MDNYAPRNRQVCSFPCCCTARDAEGNGRGRSSANHHEGSFQLTRDQIDIIGLNRRQSLHAGKKESKETYEVVANLCQDEIIVLYTRQYFSYVHTV